jgi:DNA repair protein RecN (Recombination protein N)
VASGGEASRFVLALKTAVAGAYRVPTLVFDEIDIGIGGQALQAVGDKLSELSRVHQVILVTHSPQIASRADHHLRLYKSVVDARTNIEARSLDHEERVAELARMLAGEKVTEVAREHAYQMLKEACNRR